MSIVYLCLGSNIGDRVKLLEQALSLLSLIENVKVIRTSALYETEPWGGIEQNWFLNMVVEIKTSLLPQELLQKCSNIENILGRNRDVEVHWGERPIDIDIIFFGKEVVNESNLIIPHKHLHQRAFVLVPLLELIPDFVHPVLQKSVMDLYEDLDNVEDVFLFGTRGLKNA